MRKIIAVFGIVLAAAYLQGCASGATVAGMTSLQTVDASKKNMPGKVSVATVKGGKSTNPMWTSQVSSEEFEVALNESLKANGLLSSGQGAYVLTPTLKKLQQPLFGFDLTVNAEVLYVLKESASGKELLNESIFSSYTATVSDAFVAVKRLRLANEGAIRSNIDLLMQRLSKLPLN